MSKKKLIAEVDSIVRHIETQVQLGTNRDKITAEQADLLLHTFSKLNGIEIDTMNVVSDHIKRTGVWDLTQLASFKASLRAAIATRLHQPGNCIQTMDVDYALIQADWDKLFAHPKIDVLEMYNIVASRMHRYGIICPDATTLARAHAIVETCSGMQLPHHKSSAFDINKILTKLNQKSPWPFEYIQRYPNNPDVLPKVIMDYACGPGVRPVSPPPRIRAPSFMAIVNRILYPRPAESAHQAQATKTWTRHQAWSNGPHSSRRRVQYRWLSEPDPAYTEQATKKRPATKAAAATKTKAKTLIVKRPAAMHSAKHTYYEKTAGQKREGINALNLEGGTCSSNGRKDLGRNNKQQSQPVAAPTRHVVHLCRGPRGRYKTGGIRGVHISGLL